VKIASRLIIAIILAVLVITIVCIAAYMILQKESVKVAHITGTVVPVKFIGNKTLIEAKECIVDLGNISADTFVKYVKVCSASLIIKEPVALIGSFYSVNVSRAFRYLYVRVSIEKKLSRGNFTVRIPVCIFWFRMPIVIPFTRKSEPVPMPPLLRTCIIKPGVYDVKVEIFGMTRHVDKPTKFSISLLVRVYRSKIVLSSTS